MVFNVLSKMPPCCTPTYGYKGSTHKNTQAAQIFNASLYTGVDDILPEGCQMPASREVLTLETNDDTWSSTLLFHHYGMNAKS